MSAPGDLIAQRYRLKRLVGTGGMGVVWEAFDERLHRTVAVKALHPQPWLDDAEAEVVTHRALREARITARLNHPHAVPVYDVVEDLGRPCLVMQFLPSEPLSSVLHRREVLPEHEVVALGAQVASALAAAHHAGIVHRDVKPGNVLIAQDGTARISDFGIAHALGDVTLTSTGIVAGTLEYLSPEVARGKDSGYPTDVFSLGATLYAASVGRPPFGTDSNRMALLHRVAAGLVDVPEQGSPLMTLVLEMLAVEPGDRPTMSEVAERLQGILATQRAPSRTPIAAAASLHTPSTSVPPTVGMPARHEDPPPTVGMPAPRPDPRPSPRPDPPAAPAVPAHRDAPAPAPTPAAAASPTPGSAQLPATRREQQPPQPAGASHLPPSGTPAAGPPPGTPAARPAVDPDGPLPGATATVAGSRRALAKHQRRRGPARGRRRGLALLAGVLVLLIPLYLLTSSRGEDPQVDAAPSPASSISDASATPPTTAASPTAASPTAAAPTATAPTVAPPAVAATPPTASATAPASPSAEARPAELTAADSARAVSSYYALLPGNTGQAWPLLTASYQSGRAGGRQSYERFWGTYGRVTATDVAAVGPSTVEATISYYARDGRVVRERTQFGLVKDGGVVKINSSRIVRSL